MDDKEELILRVLILGLNERIQRNKKIHWRELCEILFTNLKDFGKK